MGAEPVLVAALVATAALAAWGRLASSLERTADRRQQEQLHLELEVHRMATKLGLNPGWRSIVGVRDGFPVTVREGRWSGVAVEIGERRRGVPIPKWLGFGCARKGGPLRTGDATFDRSVAVSAPPEALALLDRKVRRTLVALCSRHRVELAAGKLRIHASGSWNEHAASELKGLISSAVNLASRLAVPEGELQRRLCRSALEDREPGVRERCLGVLGTRFEGNGEVSATARRLLDDPDAGVRLAAAALLGGEGFGALRDLALAGKPARVASRALAHLAARFPAPLVGPLLRAGLASPASSLRVAALRALAASGGADLEEAVAQRLSAPSSVERRAAVRALASVGTAASVPRLRELEARTRRLDSALRREIQAAVAGIQSRLAGAAAGQVSLAETSGGGAVSLATDGAGGAGRLANVGER